MKSKILRFVLTVHCALITTLVLTSCIGKIKGTVDSLNPSSNNSALTPLSQTIAVGSQLQFKINETADDKFFEIYSGEGQIDSTTGLFTAPNIPGYTLVKAKIGKKSFYATIQVVDKPKIFLIDNKITPNSKRSTVVIGGKPPYKFSVTSSDPSVLAEIDSNTGELQSPLSADSQAGTVKFSVKVEDSIGSTDSIEIELASKLEFVQSSLILNQGETSAPLQISGGSGKIEFKLIGPGSFNATNRTYTASSVSATAFLQAKDQAGSFATLPITINNGLNLDYLNLKPGTSQVGPNQTTQISVEGGNGPFTFQIVSGPGSVSSEGVFTPSNNSHGTTLIEVTDSFGKKGQVSINSTLDLQINMAGTESQNGQSFATTPGSETNITLTNGVSPFTLISYAGAFKDSNNVMTSSITGDGVFTYVASKDVGVDSITVIDGNGFRRNIYVTISEALKLFPQSIALNKEESFQFMVSGGSAPYLFKLVEGSGEISDTGFYTAPSVAGTSKISLKDQRETSLEAHITVLEELSVSPFYRVTGPNKKSKISITGGIAPYTITITSGQSKICATTTTCESSQLSLASAVEFEVLSGASADETLIEIRDANNSVVSTTLKNNGPMVISATNQSIELGNRGAVSISGGVPPYSLTLDQPAQTEYIQLTSRSWSLTGSQRGQSSFSIQDSDGQSISANFTMVYPPPKAILNGLPYSLNNQTSINILVSGDYVSHYKYVLSNGVNSNCSTLTYPAESTLTNPINLNIGALPDGSLTLCVVARNEDQIWQAPSFATKFTWVKDTTPPIIGISSGPSTLSGLINQSATLSGTDAYAYRYKIVDGNNAVCGTADYSAEQMFILPLQFSVNTDGDKTLCVLARDIVGNWSTSAATVSWKQDLTLPQPPTNLVLPAYSQSLTNSPALTFTAATDLNGILRYEARVVDLSQVAQSSWQVFTSGSSLSSLTLANEGHYKIQLKTLDNALNEVVVESSSWQVDNQAPSTPANFIDGGSNSQGSSSPQMTWGAATDGNGSGVAGYQIAIGTTPGGTDVKNWTSIANQTSYTATGLSLNVGQTYYSSIRAVDNAGNTSNVVQGDGWLATPDYSQTQALHPGFVPNDGIQAPILIIPKLGDNLIGAGKTLEMTVNKAGVTFTGGTSCTVVNSLCTKLADQGTGSYLIYVSSVSAADLYDFSFTLTDGGNTSALAIGFQVTFNSSQFTQLTANTTITSANANQNLYIKSGTITFDNSTVGQTFGDVFVSGGLIKHLTTNTTTEYKLDLSFASLTMTGGSIDASYLGYPNGYSFSSAGPSPAISAIGCGGGGSYGGRGSEGGAAGSSGGLPFGDFRDPKYSGGGGSNSPSAGLASGGGVIRISSNGFCGIAGAASILSNGSTMGAGGSIKLNCGGLGGALTTGTISANGGNGASNGSCVLGSGGGGRIALISSNSMASFVGSLKYPFGSTNYSAFISKVKANGGIGYSPWWYRGAAGTIYLKSSEQQYGSLIVDNNSYNVTTELPSVSGTVSTINGNNLNLTVTSTPLLSATTSDLYKNIRLRFKLNEDNGSPDNLLDDNIQTIVSHTTSQVTMDTPPLGLASGDGFRSIDVLDYMDVSSNTTLRTYGDLVVLNGSLNTNTTGKFQITNSIIEFKNGSMARPKIDNYIWSAGTFAADLSQSKNLNVSGTANITSTTNLTLDSVTTTSGTLTVEALTLASDYSHSGGNLIVKGTFSLGGNLNISGGTLAANLFNINGNFNQTGGTLTHASSTTTTEYKLNLNVVGSFSLSGGAIDVSGKGYPNGYSFSESGPSPTISAIGCGGGGSHGGRGSDGGAAGSSGGLPFGDYRDPQYSGGGGSSSPSAGLASGGGVIRINTNSVCNISGAGSVRANGSGMGAGGSIYLNCGGYAGTLTTGSITANGGDGGPNGSCVLGSGGGGRIALISKSDINSFSGSLTYPLGSTNYSAFISKVKANGGIGYSPWWYRGAAGTIYVKHASQNYGALIIDNNGYNITTEMLSVAGTVSSISGNNLGLSLTSLPALANTQTNLYKNLRIRFSPSFDNGTPDNILDDKIQTLSASSTTNVTADSVPNDAVVGDAVRSFDLLDYLEISGSTTVKTYGDIAVLSGSLSNGAGNLNLNNGFINFQNGAKTYPNINNYAFSSGTFSGDLSKISTLSISGTANITSTTTANLSSLIISGGTLNLPGLNLTGSYTQGGGNLILTGATTISNDLNLNGGILSATQLNVLGNYNQTGGTLKHPATSTSLEYKLDLNVTGTFNLTGGSIDVSGMGYQNGYAFGNTGPSTAIASTGCGVGGSHGGRGSGGGAGGLGNIVFGDYKNPYNSGGGGSGSPSAGLASGGGVIRIISQNTCTVSGAASIRADGNIMGAGGSIFMQCNGFAGSLTSGLISAVGGDGGSNGSCVLGAGGGGRIAIISTGDVNSLNGSFTYPMGSTNLANLKSKIKVYGGRNASWGYTGASGTLFIKHSGLEYGDLILDNRGYAISTDLISATDNSNIINNDVSSTTLQVTAAGSPFTGRLDYFKGSLLHIYPSAASDDPKDISHTPALITSNGTNTFVASGANFPTIAADYKYRIVHQLNHLDIGGSAILNLGGSDLYLRAGPTESCDLHSASSNAFDVPAGSSLTVNSFSANNCLNTLKSGTINMTNNFLN